MPKLAVYIDEAGDPGVKDGLRYIGDRHEWLAISGVVTRHTREPETVEWIKELREVARSRQSGVLHYHRITRERREGVCKKLATLPLRAFVLISHKSNLREYINPRIKAQMNDQTFYNWCVRLMLERVTAWSHNWMSKNDGGLLEPLAITFANRGGHDYDHLFSYMDRLRFQAMNGQLILKGPGLEEPTLDREFWQIAETHECAGLQLADTVASSFYQAANHASPAHALEPALALMPIIYRRRVAANTGLTVWPLPHQATIPEDARTIFRAYGYKW